MDDVEMTGSSPAEAAVEPPAAAKAVESTRAVGDPAYSKPRRKSSLDSRAAPFVPGIGRRLSQGFGSIGMNDNSSPDEGEADGGYRRGSGGLLVRTHHNIEPLSVALGYGDSHSSDRSSSGSDGSFSRRGSSGGFVVRSYRDVPPLSSAASLSSGNAKERETPATETPSSQASFAEAPSSEMPSTEILAAEAPSIEAPSMEVPSIEISPTETSSAGTHSAETPSEETRSSEISSTETPSAETLVVGASSSEIYPSEKASPPPLPPRPSSEGEDGDGGSCACAAADPVTKPSAWEQASASRVEVEGSGRSNDNGVSNDNGSSNGRAHSAGVRVSDPGTTDVRIFCGTWNVAGRKLDRVDDMGQWLDVDQLDAQDEASDSPDIFVVGFQEVVELSAQNVVMDSFLDTQSRANSLHWFTLVYAYLAKYGQRHGVKYVMVSEKRLLGTYVLVMATEALCTKIANVQSAVIPTGLGGYFGNKGAVAVRMEIAGTTSLSFVCVHMAAHREQVLARNAEYKLISSRPVFADTSGRLPPAEGAAAGVVVTAGKDGDRRQASTWGNMFGGAGQGGRSGGGGSGGGVGSGGGGMSPTRNLELKKAIKAAMAFGLSRGGGAAGAVAGAGAGAGKAATGEGERLGTSGGRDGKGTSSSVADAEEDEEAKDLACVASIQNVGAGLPKTKTVLQADIVFWIGDLNYRISENVSDQSVFEMLKNDDLESLRGEDQLNHARASGAAFQDFQEGPLCFPPTYKYIPGTRELDNRPEKKVRCPSWCDRVLYSVGMQSGDSVRRLGLDRYWSSGPLLSDHMPVSALFRASLACAPEKRLVEPEIVAEPLDPPRRAVAAADADAAAIESTPFARVVLDPPALMLALGPTPAVQSAKVGITNTGGVRGKFHVCKDSLPGWMNFDGGGDGRGVLEPGATEEIRFAVDAAAAEAAAGAESTGDGPRQACAVLRVEVDGGGSGTLLAAVCTFGD